MRMEHAIPRFNGLGRTPTQFVHRRFGKRNTAEHSNDWIFDGHAFNLTVPGTYSSQHHCHSPWIRSYQHVRALSSLGAKITIHDGTGR